MNSQKSLQNAIEITANGIELGHTSNMNNGANTMNRVIGYTSLTAYIAISLTDPVIGAAIALVAFLAIYMIDMSIRENTQRAIALQSLRTWSESLRDENRTEVVPEITVDDSDLWENVIVEEITVVETDTMIELPKYQLCLPSAMIEEVEVIDYTTMTYAEIKAIVKATRKNVKDIKLNAKKADMIAWLQTV